MKKRIFAAVITAMMTVSMAVSAFAADIESDLIGKFTFDENITNAVTGEDAKIIAQKGLGPDAAAVEYTFPFVDGVDGKALHLGTDTTGAANTNALNLNLKVKDDQNYTFSVWVKAFEERVNFACPVVWMGKAVQSPENWVGIWPGLAGDYANGPCFGANGIIDSSEVVTRLGAVPLTDEGLGIKKPVNAEVKTTFEWTNITAVVKDGIAWLYYDGKLVASTEGKNGTNGDQQLTPHVNEDDTVSIYLGANYWDAPFVGYVDDLYIYDRALTTEDVVALVTETNKAGVALGDYSEYVTTTTIDYTKKPSINKNPDWVQEEEDSMLVPIIIAAAVVVVLVVVIVLVLVVSKSKKKDDAEEDAEDTNA
ncbi:MAG: LamG domain-containing protein [Lachnospiraceae bacterium]|nr:LamG domain-containing protein [Lachnospiraceae bacterium]